MLSISPYLYGGPHFMLSSFPNRKVIRQTRSKTHAHKTRDSGNNHKISARKASEQAPKGTQKALWVSQGQVLTLAPALWGPKIIKK